VRIDELSAGQIHWVAECRSACCTGAGLHVFSPDHGACEFVNNNTGIGYDVLSIGANMAGSVDIPSLGTGIVVPEIVEYAARLVIGVWIIGLCAGMCRLV